MKRKHHFSIAAAIAALGIYRELLGQVPGTGETVGDLMKAGYSQLEIARYFPWTILNLVLMLGAILWGGTILRLNGKLK